jgi:hypothetical protein
MGAGMARVGNGVWVGALVAMLGFSQESINEGDEVARPLPSGRLNWAADIAVDNLQLTFRSRHWPSTSDGNTVSS